MSILIVDDSPDNVLPLKLFLETTGYTDLRTAESAEEAFEQLGLEDPASRGRGIDVVLMDVRMPGLDGIQACQRIKKNDRLRDIPVIMVTAQSEERHLEAAFNAGANDYITKPVKTVELLARLRSALSLKREMDCRKSREQELLKVTRQLEQANRELQRLSTLDGLTGIANRRQFDHLFNRSWRHALRTSEPIAVIMIDIDYFKAFNDTHGHQKGDDCLKQVAGALSRTLHRSGDLVARYGGEEFVVMLPDTDARGAAIVAEALRAQVKGLELVHGASPVSEHVTISLGVAGAIPEPNSSPPALLAEADRALYHVKQNGRNSVQVAEPGPFSAPAAVASRA